MDIKSLFGLPAHPLLVHLPVVGIPILALLALVMVARPRWRGRMATPVAAFAIVIAGATILAAGAGEQLEERVRESSLVERHAELGEQTRLLVLVFGGLLVAYAAGLRLKARDAVGRLEAVLPILLLVSVLAGAAATVWDVRTGHAGAKAVWTDTPAAQSAGGEGDER